MRRAVGGIGAFLLLAAGAVGVYVYVKHAGTDARKEVPDPGSSRGTLEQAAAKAAYLGAARYASKQPEDYEGQIQRYARVLDMPRCSWSLRANRKVKEIRAVWRTVAQAEYENVRARVDALQTAGDFEGALALLDWFARDQVNAPGVPDMKPARRRVVGAARARFAEIVAEADRLCDAGKFAEARERLSQAKGFGVPEIVAKVDACLATVDEAEAPVLAQARKFARQRYPAFQTRLHGLLASGEYDAALKLLAAAALDPRWVPVSEEVDADSREVEALSAFWDGISAQAEGLKGGANVMVGLSGRIVSVEGTVLQLDLGSATKAVDLKTMDWDTVERMAAGAAPRDPFTFSVGRAFYLNLHGQDVLAAKYLAALNSRAPRVVRLSARVDVARRARREQEARRLFAFAETAFNGTLWQHAAKSYRKLVAEYRDIAFVAENREAIAQKTAKADEALAEAARRKPVAQKVAKPDEAPAETPRRDPPPAPKGVLFNGRDLSGWEQDGGEWTVSDGAIRGTSPEGTANCRLTRSGRWTDFEFSARVKLLKRDNAGLIFRVHGDRYLWFGSASGLWGGVHATRALNGRGAKMDMDCWYHVRVVLDGRKFQGYVDGKLTTEYDDLDVADGAVGIRVHNGTTALFRDVKLIPLR